MKDVFDVYSHYYTQISLTIWTACLIRTAVICLIVTKIHESLIQSQKLFYNIIIFDLPLKA
jgi:hypothetical protein